MKTFSDVLSDFIVYILLVKFIVLRAFFEMIFEVTIIVNSLFMELFSTSEIFSGICALGSVYFSLEINNIFGVGFFSGRKLIFNKNLMLDLSYLESFEILTHFISWKT